MVAVPITPPGNSVRFALPSGPSPAVSDDWTKYVAAGALIAGAAMMIAGNKRTGMAVAATGTALALLDEQEAVQTLWKNLPGYLREAQNFLENVEGYMEEAVDKGHKLQSMLRR